MILTESEDGAASSNDEMNNNAFIVRYDAVKFLRRISEKISETDF